MAGILAGPVWLLLEGVAVEVAPDVATAALILSASFGSHGRVVTYRVAIVIPSATNATALFQDDEVATVVAFDEIDCGAHARVPVSI